MTQQVDTLQQHADFSLLTGVLKALPETHPVRLHFEARLFASCEIDESSDFDELFHVLGRMIAERNASLLALL